MDTEKVLEAEMETLFETEIEKVLETEEREENTERTLEQIFAEVTLLNGEETEEDLNMAIAQELVNERHQKDILTPSIEKLESEIDTGKKLEKGAFVYQNESLFSWTFEKYDTMVEAVRAAVLLVNASVLYNGKEVVYDALSEKDAYYIDNDTNKVMLITL